MNNILETAIKNKIAIEMIEYLGNASIEEIPMTIQYAEPYEHFLKEEQTTSEIIDYATSEYGLQYGWDRHSENFYIPPEEMLGLATEMIFYKYFDEDIIFNTFTIEKFKKSLKLLRIDIWDVLEMKYICHM